MVGAEVGVGVGVTDPVPVIVVLLTGVGEGISVVSTVTVLVAVVVDSIVVVNSSVVVAETVARYAEQRPRPAVIACWISPGPVQAPTMQPPAPAWTVRVLVCVLKGREMEERTRCG